MIAATATELHNLGPVERIPLGEGRAYRLAGREIAVFRTRSGDVFAVQADCPHRGGPLADGLVGGGRVVCPLHSYSFDLATGEPVHNPCPALQVFPAAVSPDGDLLVGADPSSISDRGSRTVD